MSESPLGLQLSSLLSSREVSANMYLYVHSTFIQGLGEPPVTVLFP